MPVSVVPPALVLAERARHPGDPAGVALVVGRVPAAVVVAVGEAPVPRNSFERLTLKYFVFTNLINVFKSAVS